MKTKLTLQEKLRDLRDEKKMTLSDLAGATNISLSTLQRMEGQDDIRVGYQDVAALAKFYDVSTDYLFGLTDNRQHRHIEVDALKLSDAAIETLTGEKFNNRLVSELLSHPDFPKLSVTVGPTLWGYIILLGTMIINFVTEFCVYRFWVYRVSINTSEAGKREQEKVQGA